MMKFIPELLFLIVFQPATSVGAADFSAPECEPLEQFDEVKPQAIDFGSGLLWKISKAGIAPSYVFGTIHVADESIVNLPDAVNLALARAKTFVMEVVPNPPESMAFAGRMYLNRGQKLSDLLSVPLFNKVVRLLSAYHLPRETVTMMKPWAAFLTMSYPPEFRQVLDLQLLETARRNGAAVIGLESLQEQVAIFDTLALDKQVKLLSDIACHYEIAEADFDKMKSLYIARDLSGLYAYSQRYSLSGDDLYNELIKKLLTRRNDSMAKRMQAILQEGNAFIAIGATHLPGEKGVLSLLAARNYEISLVY